MYFKLPAESIGSTVLLFGEANNGFRVILNNTTINGSSYYNATLYSPTNTNLMSLAANGVVTSSNVANLKADTGYYLTFI
jgi:hypothetical protein